MREKKCIFIHKENLDKNSGTNRKALAQFQALQSLFPSKLLTVNHKKGRLRFIDNILLYQLNTICYLLQENNCLIYYRYYQSNLLLNWFFYFLRKRNHLYVEVNSKINNELKITNKLLYLINKLSEKIVYKAAHAVLPVTPELADYVHSIEPSCRTRVLGNGYDYLEVNTVPSINPDLREFINLGKHKTKFIFVFSEGQIWQGLDKIIDIINLSDNFCLYIVGRIDRLQNMGLSTSSLAPDKFFILGLRDAQELKFLYENCDFAFGSFAWERLNMTEAVPLKVREYLYFGLPVIIGYVETQITGVDFLHKYRDIDSLRHFISKSFDRERIKNYARTNLSWRSIFAEVFKQELASINR
jgi:glycosyltransferase involved in cell wall biosynthesis